MHAIQGMYERAAMDDSGPRSQMGGKNGQWTYKTAKEAVFGPNLAFFTADLPEDPHREEVSRFLRLKDGVWTYLDLFSVPSH